MATCRRVKFLSLLDALPIFGVQNVNIPVQNLNFPVQNRKLEAQNLNAEVLNRNVEVLSLKRSEEHTSELQSRPHLVCRLLLEKKNAGDSVLNGNLPPREISM